jgi:putative flippase GtrA
MSAALANAAALLATAVANTAANRRLTFGVRGAESLGRHHLAGLIAFGVALSMTSAATALLGVLAPRASHIVELVVLSATNALATVVRFFLLRIGIARRRSVSPPSLHPERTIP